VRRDHRRPRPSNSRRPLVEDIGWSRDALRPADPQRVSLYFKSSWIGSYNHSHADQNQFVLNAFGEALAIDSGYYDWYASDHDKGYTRHTLAHNAITYDGGHGQPIFDATASGQLLGRVSTPSIDLTGGDATAAYHGGLAKAVRRIVYLRPATFVVIDDLAAPAGQTRQFESWLHALSPIAFDADQAGALVSQGEARLTVRVHTPTGVTAQQREQFIGPPESYPAGAQPTPIRPEGRGEEWDDQHHAWFTTPESGATRIVTSMQAHQAGATVVPVTSTKAGETLVLNSAAGQVAVALADGIRAGELASDAPVVAWRGAAVALADGTWLERAGQRVILADRPISVGWEGDLISIAAADDTTVTIVLPRPPGLWDERGRPVPAERGAWTAG